ncbi:MAG: CBS domain-containing protein [Bdellovibrionales bacterium]|jgi:Kef-type K+ transport system membrane component KefB/CBS domain-containing protein|nr:CBS domain-containing protein [Bdellovibrionales bacterium]MBT3526767.1 CBS domain-containing protein [Bdellovibrionales bacterium]MBT7766527.1 CBS domain-containing protein [Bdellovibrionales bacterium]
MESTIEVAIDVVPILGLALTAAFIIGKIAHQLNIPQVTGYILTGVVFGPTGFNLLSEDVVTSFESINDIAFGLILFNIGGEFHRNFFKQVAWTHVRYSLVYGGLIFLIVFFSCFLFAGFTELDLAGRLVVSSFLGIVATAAAPPTTLLVIKENHAEEGALAQTVMVFLALGTILSVVGSHVIALIFQNLGVWSGQSDGHLVQLLYLLWSIGGSVLAGFLLGLMLSYWEQREQEESELLLAVICSIIFGLALSHYLHLEPLLISLFMGFFLVNLSPAGLMIHVKIKGMGLSIYAIFFVLAGAHIHLQEQVVSIGVLGIGYVLSRIVAMLVSSTLAARLTKEQVKVGRYMGWATLSHAGAAMAIVIKLRGEVAVSAEIIETVVLSSIFIFEIIGPVTLRHALIRFGEVKVGAILDHVTSRATFSIVDMFHYLWSNLGLLSPNHDHHYCVTTIKPLVDRSVVAVNAKANMSEVISYIRTHSSAIYPVVDDDHLFKGVLSINELKRAMFDPLFCRMVVAERLIVDQVEISEDSTIEEAITLFGQRAVEALPVTRSNSNMLVGIIYHKDVIFAAHK